MKVHYQVHESSHHDSSEIYQSTSLNLFWWAEIRDENDEYNREQKDNTPYGKTIRWKLFERDKLNKNEKKKRTSNQLFWTERAFNLTAAAAFIIIRPSVCFSPLEIWICVWEVLCNMQAAKFKRDVSETWININDTWRLFDIDVDKSQRLNKQRWLNESASWWNAMRRPSVGCETRCLRDGESSKFTSSLISE